jgi:FeS assembly SUF system protein
MGQMIEKIQDSETTASAEDIPPVGAGTATAAPEEPAEMKACVVGEEGLAPSADQPKGDGSSIPPADLERLRDDLIAALKTVFDPEIPVDIYELGLIYRLDVDDDRNIEVDMTLTAPGCPVAGDMPGWVENAVSSVPGVGQVKVNLVFDPPWDMSRMSEEAQLALNMF